MTVQTPIYVDDVFDLRVRVIGWNANGGCEVRPVAFGEGGLSIPLPLTTAAAAKHDTETARIIASPAAVDRAVPDPRSDVGYVRKDDVLSLLVNRMAEHAGKHASVSIIDYGRLEELSWLIRAVMAERWDD